MIQLSQPIRTATHLGWNVVSMPHSGEHVQVAYSLTLNGEMVEQDIKTLEGVIVDGSVSLEAITNALVTELNNM